MRLENYPILKNWKLISGDNLEYISKEIKKLGKLKRLYLDNLSIKELPKEIKYLKNLEYLELISLKNLENFQMKLENCQI